MNIQEILFTLVVGAISVAVSFYLKDFIKQKSQHGKLRKKLEKIAGKNASVIYGDDGEVFKIVEIDENGVTLQNELKTVFIPTGMLLQTEMVLPSNDYSKIIKEKKDKEEVERTKLLVQEMKSMFPSLMGPLRKDSKEIRDAMIQLLEKREAGAKDKDPTGELLSLLIKSGAIQQPDLVQLLGVRLTQFLVAGETSDSKDESA